jgi:hypothetical protein
MKALILNQKVVDLSQDEFPVHESMVWVNCINTVQIGWSYIGNEFTPPPAEPQINPILLQILNLEGQITNRRLREAFLGIDNGWLANIEAQIVVLRGQL